MFIEAVISLNTRLLNPPDALRWIQMYNAFNFHKAQITIKTKQLK